MQTSKIAGQNGLYYVRNPIQVVLTKPNAEMPYKENPSDIGWDVTLIGRDEERVEDTFGEVSMFLTGLKICPPPGYYLEMMVRSSLHKSGYMLVTGTSVIDPGYIGEIKVPLYKFREGDDLQLPFQGVQFILRSCEYAHLQSSKSLEPTVRGEGGFGSTGFGLATPAPSKLSLRTAVDDDEDVPRPRPRRTTTAATKKKTGHFG